MYTVKAEYYGATFDGVTDDTAALQLAIDTVSATGGILEFPPGTAIISAPLDLRQRFITIHGAGAAQFSGTPSVGKTYIKAGVPMTQMLNIDDPYDPGHGVPDQLFSPLVLDGLILDAAGKAAAGITISHRHNTVLQNLIVLAATTVGIKERDTWLSRRYNCRVEACARGWHLAGANHSSLFAGCSFNGASDVHLLIEANGTEDGLNLALHFQACDVEGSLATSGARGIDIGANCTVAFDSCYLGEFVEGPVITNRGNVQVRGGALFFGWTPDASAVHPAKGRLLIEGTSLMRQFPRGGQPEMPTFPRLVSLTPTEVTEGDYGRVRFANVQGTFNVAGTQLLAGDPLDYGPAANVFAARLGRCWSEFAANCTVNSIVGTGAAANARSVVADAVDSAGGTMGLVAPLKNTEWRQGEPLYLVVVYKADREVQIRLAGGTPGDEPITVLGNLPASETIVTAIVGAAGPHSSPSGEYGTLSLLMSAVVEEGFTLYEAFFADNSVTNSFPDDGSGNVHNLLKC